MICPLAVVCLLSIVDPGAGRELQALEQALANALHTRDKALLDTLLADDYILRSEPDVPRDTWVHAALTRCWGDRFDLSDFQVRTHDDVSVVTFVLTSYVDPETCRPATVRSLITDFWAYDAGRWRLTVRHSGPVPSDSAGLAGQYGLLAPAPAEWKVDGELSFVATGGNASTHTLGLASAVEHRASFGTTQANVSFVTSGSRGVTQARSTDVQGRHGIHLRDGADLFGRVSYTRDRFAGSRVDS